MKKYILIMSDGYKIHTWQYDDLGRARQELKDLYYKIAKPMNEAKYEELSWLTDDEGLYLDNGVTSYAFKIISIDPPISDEQEKYESYQHQLNIKCAKRQYKFFLRANKDLCEQLIITPDYDAMAALFEAKRDDNMPDFVTWQNVIRSYILEHL